MLKFIKKFDVHTKTIDGASQQTLFGAFATVVALFAVFFLVYSETQLFVQKEVVSRMVADSTVGPETLTFIFDVEFLNITCSKLSTSQEFTRGTIHQSSEDIQKTSRGTDGCRVTASIVMDKADGYFRVGVDSSTGLELGADAATNFDVSHVINQIAFEAPTTKSAKEKFPEITFPLKDKNIPLPNSVGLQHYALKVVPTYWKAYDGVATHINQYSVTDRVVDSEHLSTTGVIIASQYIKGFYGILVTFDFSPVVLMTEERQENLFEFLSALCGIVGGFITVMSILDKCIYSSSKALLGKKD